MTQINCIVVTPEATALEEHVDFVALPLYDGEIGIGRDHTPLIGRLGYGEMRLRVGDQVRRYYVDGGFVQVADNQVSVLTHRAMPAEEVDEAAAQKQLDEALKQRATTHDEFQARDRALAQARAQLRVARRGT